MFYLWFPFHTQPPPRQITDLSQYSGACTWTKLKTISRMTTKWHHWPLCETPGEAVALTCWTYYQPHQNLAINKSMVATRFRTVYLGSDEATERASGGCICNEVFSCSDNYGHVNLCQRQSLSWKKTLCTLSSKEKICFAMCPLAMC